MGNVERNRRDSRQGAGRPSLVQRGRRGGSLRREAGGSRAFRGFEHRFAGIDFEELGIAGPGGKDAFLAALWELRDFRGRGFSFDRLCDKIIALFRYAGESHTVIQLWMYHAILSLGESASGTVYGNVLGIAGEISGIFEAIFRQNTTLAGIKLGEFSEIEMAVRDEGGVIVKEFDAVSVERREGKEADIVTVFEFKFALSLRKLYEQVVGIDSAKVPHLEILTQYGQFRHVRNLVYFGEVGDGYISRAIRQFLTRKPLIARRVKVTKKGYSIKLLLPEVGEFLCDPNTLQLARDAGSRFIPRDPHSPEYRRRIRKIKGIIRRKIRQERNKATTRFDVIVAVSNAPARELASLRKVIQGPAAGNPGAITANRAEIARQSLP